jgi:hypothetical protein
MVLNKHVFHFTGPGYTERLRGKDQWRAEGVAQALSSNSVLPKQTNKKTNQ